jgi:hypothetical protein
MMIAAAMLAGTAVDAQAQGLSSDDRARLK